MSNATASAQNTSAPTELTIQKPTVGSNIMVDLPKDAPAAFNFAVEDVRAMQLLSDGGLLIKFIDGSTLTVSNFSEARDNFPFSEIQMSDGTVMNLQKVSQGLAGTVPNDSVADLTILKPQGGLGVTDLKFALQEGKTYTLGFDMKDVASVESQGTDLLVTFKDGSKLTLENYDAVNMGALPPQMTLADGSVIPASQLVNVLNVAMADQVKEVEPAAGETAADAEAQIAAKQVAAKQVNAEELAQIEPAAGTPGAGGAGGAGGYGFNSAVDAASITGINAVGPIGPTSLAFRLPTFEEFPQAEAVAAPGAVPFGPPSLTSPDQFGYEDTAINLDINASGTNPGQETLTITIENIPTGWDVDIAKSGGSYDAATGTWTVTLPQGTSYSGGPYLIPPHDSDADIKLPSHGPLKVTVSSLDSVTGTTLTTTDDMNVVVDAVADKPDLAVQNVSGSDNVPLPLDIQAAVVDTDGSEVLTTATLTGIPAGFTLNHGTLAGGVWTVNASDLPTLTLTAPAGFGGSFVVTVTVNNREANLTDQEVTLTNNTNFNTESFTVTFVDTAPIVGDSVASVDDTGLSGGNNVVTGSVSINYQADTPGSFAAQNNFTSTGSKLAGNLTSNGFPVTVVLVGNTYTGTANGKTIFTMVVQPNGQYTFTQMEQLDHADGNNPNDVINLNFTVAGTDSDGDVDTGTITVQVLDDAPVAVADNFLGGVTATGDITTNDQFSQDTFAAGAANKVFDVVFGGQTVVLPTDGSNTTITNASGTLVINNNGIFTYTPPAPGVDATFKYRLIDFDGDKSAATADAGTTVTIDLDGKPSITGSAVTVDETNLDDTGVAQVVNGTYTFSYGADGAGSITTTGYTGPNLTSNGVAIVITQQPAGTFIGTANGSMVFSMVIRADGTYTFSQFDQLDHPDATNHDDALNLTFGLTITDADGDTANASLTAVVRDDGPVAINDNFVSATGTATGNIILNDDVGADEPGFVYDVTFGGQTVVLNTDGSNSTITNASGTLVINKNGQFTFTPPVPGQDTTFQYRLVDSDNDKSVVDAQHGQVTIDTNGVPTITGSSVTVDETNLDDSGLPQTVVGTYTFNYGGDGQGNGSIELTGSNFPALTSGGVPVLLAMAGNTMIGTANGVEVFRMVVGTNGTYSFTQSKPLDHPDATNADDALNLVFNVRITDADGSTATTTLTAVVRDDGPVAVNDNFVSSSGTASGNIMTNDDVGADEPGKVYDVTFGGQTVVLNANGSNSTITNASGTLVINNTGQFTFTPPLPGQNTTFQYRLVDFDGDKSVVDAQHGQVTVETNAKPVIGDDSLFTDETSLVNGPAITNGSFVADFGGDGPGTITANNVFTSTGSKTGGNLTSHGSPVAVTVAGNVYTGKDALGNTVFTLTVNNNGTYTFTQFEQLDHADGTNPNDIITLNFGVIGKDTDGETDTGTITVNVRDDAPAALNDTVNLVGNTATGNILANDTLGQDTPVPVTQIMYNNVSYTVPANGTNLTIVAANGTLVINNTGAYTYTSNGVTAGTDTFNYKITDFDGDSATANLSVTVADIDYVPVIGDSTATVDETGLGPVSATGTVSSNYFNDGPGSITPTATFSSSGSKLNDALTSNGATVTVALAGNTYTGTAGGQTVFTLVVNANGSYTYTQFKPLDHKDSNNANDVINLNFTVVGTDSDGDTDTGTITINVVDDAPIAVNDTNTTTGTNTVTGNFLTNDDLSTDAPNLVTQVVFNNVTYTVPANGTNTTITGTFGTLVINNTGSYSYTSKNTAEGTDVFTYTVKDFDQDPSTATFTATVTDIDTTPIVTTTTTTVDESGTKTSTGTITADFGDDGPGSFLVCSGNNFSSDGSKLNGNLTSGGVAVTVTSTASGYIGAANGLTVFTLNLAANGKYTFTLARPLDHADPLNPNDIINLNFMVCAKDADGSVGHGTLTVKVVDDAPIANNDTTIYCIDDGVHNGNIITGWHNTNAGGADQNTSFDAPSWLYSVKGTYGGTANIPMNGAATVEGAYGTLHVYADGTYYYVQKITGIHTDTFTYMLKDGDGDTSAATLTITSVPKGGYTNDSMVHEHAGTINGTDGNDLLMATTSGASDTLYGGKGNDGLFGWSGNDNLYGGEGNDTLYGEYGADNLWGGAGADMFVANRADLSGGPSGTFVDTVKDFNAAEGDVIDFAALIDNSSGAQAAINDYVRAVTVGSNTMLQVRSTGTGSWKDAMLVENHTSLDVQTLFNNGNIDVA